MPRRRSTPMASADTRRCSTPSSRSPRPDDSKARLLLDHGADPNARATIRKQLRHMGDPEKETMREFHNVTPIGYARQWQEPSWVNGPAISAIAERGGTE